MQDYRDLLNYQEDLQQRWQRLRRKLESNRPWLQRQGCLVSKQVRGRWVCHLRFYALVQGSRQQRSLHLGQEPELVERTKQWLEQVRAPLVEAQMALRLAHVAKVAARLLDHLAIAKAC